MKKKIFNKYRLVYGLEKKLFLMIGATGMLLVIILGVIIATVSGDYLYKSNMQLLDSQTNQTVDYFDNYLVTLKNTATTLSRQRSVISIINGTASGYDAYTAYRDAYESLKSIHDFDNKIETYLFATKQLYVMSSKSSDVTSDFTKYKTNEMDWYRNLINSDASQNYISNFVPPISGGEEEFAFTLTVRDIYDWSIQGFLVASIPKSAFGSGHGQNNYQFSIWDNDGSPIFLSPGLTESVDENELKYISAKISNGEPIPEKSLNGDFHLPSSVSAQTGWSFVSFYSNADAKHNTQVLQWTVTLTTVVCVILLLIIAMVISRRTIGPVNRLIRAMHEVEEDEFSKRIDIAGKDEVGELIETFNKLIVSVRNNQILRKRAEIDALQKQMDPHFLFNTLESIRVLSLTGDNRLVSTMIEKLADVFRYNINREAVPIATISDEIQHIRNYVDIQQVRFSNRLSIEYIVDEAILSCTTLKFILQPIVENSIRHSLETRETGCCLTLEGHMVGDNIVFSIMDNGIGIQPQRLEQMKNFIFDTTGTVLPQGFGIGLKNIQERLSLFYGGAYGLTLESEYGRYTKVTVTIPKV